MSVEALKRAAGYRAAEFVHSGMVVGLGSGSTARHATLRLAEKLRTGILRNIVAVPTSKETACLARQEGIPLLDQEESFEIDITIDGADEVDPQLNVLKGLGGFLLREKVVAAATRQEIIVVDDSKLVARLGAARPVPIEVLRFGWRNTAAILARTGARPALRLANGMPYITDEGNYILDCVYAGGVAAPAELECRLNRIPGVVENGLFLGVVATVVVASPTRVSILQR